MNLVTNVKSGSVITKQACFIFKFKVWKQRLLVGLTVGSRYGQSGRPHSHSLENSMLIQSQGQDGPDIQNARKR